MTVATFQERFAPELMPLVHPVDSVKVHPNNPRTHADKALEASIVKYGQMTPLTVQKSTMFICKGNGTYEAMVRLGYTNVAYHVVDMDDATALQYLHVDNRTSDLAAYDAVRTLEGLKALEAGPGLMGLWDTDALEDLEFQVNGPSTLAPEFTGGYADKDAPEAAERDAKDKKPGQKMKEVPVVLTVQEHAEFMAALRLLAPHLGTQGTIATIVAAVKNAAAELEGKGKPLAATSADEVRFDTLSKLAAYYDDKGKQYFSGDTIALQMTEAAAQFRPKVEPPKELPGQTHMTDVVDVDAPEARPMTTADFPELVNQVGQQQVLEEMRATPSGAPYVNPRREPGPGGDMDTDRDEAIEVELAETTDDAVVEQPEAEPEPAPEPEAKPELPPADEPDPADPRATRPTEEFHF
jgi:hypothetical protein